MRNASLATWRHACRAAGIAPCQAARVHRHPETVTR
nr:MAG TPA: hypothetical protein [Caudoviricetes sp.]